MTRIGIFISTTRPNRVGPHVAQWIADQAPAGFEADLIDLREVDLPFLAEPKSPSRGDYELQSTRDWAARVDSYDGFIVALAEYNGGAPAVFKNALDTVYAEWHDKPVAVVGYGFHAAAHAQASLEKTWANLKVRLVQAPDLTFKKELTVDGTVTAGEELTAQVAALYPALEQAGARSAQE